MRTRWMAALAIVLAIGITGTDTSAQKGNKPSPSVTGGPSDAVFADLDGLDRIKSDGYPTTACSSGVLGEESRYCGGSFTDPETGLTYGGVGPECSRISYGSNGDYSFRTISSKCASYPPLADVGHRRLVLDLTDHLTGRCRNADASDDFITRTVGGDPKTLNACGPNTVDDVRIIASGMFAGDSAAVTVYISLHAPPYANTTQFLLEFGQPVPVIDHGPSRTLMATTAQTAVLWEMVTGKNGKLQKAATPIGEYALPFSLTARKVLE